MTKKIKGFATVEGTKAYSSRFSWAPGHFRQATGLWFSSIGIGSYIGKPDAETDRGYEEAVKEALQSGINVLDSAINYRGQRSERSFGRALGALIQEGKLKREEVIVCTKGGFLPFDGDYPRDPPGYFQNAYLKTGLLEPEDIVQGCHAMTPRYLEDQLEKSLENLGVEAIDIYYVHNPETQLAEVDRKIFTKRLQKAFELLEKKVSEGKIRMYGIATWSGFRISPEKHEYLSLENIQILAREAGGAGHHFKAVQLPVNLAMPEAWVLANQNYGADKIPFLETAQKLGILVIASASLLQGQLAGPFPPGLQQLFSGLEKSAQCSIQFVRSLSGVTTALVGMKNKNHVRENLETARISPLSKDNLIQLFQKTG